MTTIGIKPESCIVSLLFLIVPTLIILVISQCPAENHFERVCQIFPYFICFDKMTAELIEKFLPVFYFHPREDHYPIDFSVYVGQSALKNMDTGEIIEPNMTIEKLRIWDNRAGNFSLFLPAGADSQVFSLGASNMADRPVYVQTFFRGDNDLYINYLLFYCVNPPLHLFFCVPVGFHYADIENVQVHLVKKGDNWELNRVYFSKHSGGNWVDKKNVEFLDGRPVVYVAQNSHASYEKSGTVFRFGGCVLEYVAKGLFWRPEKHVLISPEQREFYFYGDLGDGRVANFYMKSCFGKEEIDKDFMCA